MSVRVMTEEKFFGGYKSTASDGRTTGRGEGPSQPTAEKAAIADLQRQQAEKAENKN